MFAKTLTFYQQYGKEDNNILNNHLLKFSFGIESFEIIIWRISYPNTDHDFKVQALDLMDIEIQFTYSVTYFTCMWNEKKSYKE